MARIIYGVCGEGMGHATRSRPVLDHLTKSNRVKIFSSGKAYNYLAEKFSDVGKVDGLFIKYKDNQVAKIRTLLFNLLNICGIMRSIRGVMKEIGKFKPDVIISDFEIITAYAALFKGIPMISIDNQHVYDKTRIDFPKRLWWDYIQTRLVNRLIMIHARYYLVTTFFYGKPKSKRVLVIPPLLREDILKIKAKDKGHIMVYQTSDTNKRLIDTLKKINRKTIIYGFDKDEVDGNIIFKRFDKKGEKRFLDDLACCSAVIINGGFTMMSEALYLGKPVLSIPVVKQFEQNINAIYLDRLGYGKYIKRADEKSLSEFISNISSYKKNLKGYEKRDNSMALKKLDSLISDIIKT